MTGPPISGEYPDDWDAIALAVKSAARWRCVRCLKRHNIAAGFMLTVHHFDGNKGNCLLWNLPALCQRCHLRIQARVDLRQPVLVLPSVWAMPYIAGFLEANDLGGLNPLYNLDAWTIEYTTRAQPRPVWAPQSDTSRSLAKSCVIHDPTVNDQIEKR